MARATAVLAALALLGAAAPAPPVTRRMLPNGMTVLVRESRAAAVVAMSLQVRAGSRFETAETAGITNFLQRVMLRGTRRHDARQLIEAAQDLGGALDASGDVEYAEVRATGLARGWERLLELVAEVALDPPLPPAEVERERRLLLSRIQTREDNPLTVAIDALLQDLYGPHPYALPVLGRRATVERFSRDDLRAQYQRIYRPDRLVLAVSGDVDGPRVARLAERLFGRLTASAGERPGPASAPASTGARRVLQRPGQQAQILVGFLGPRLADTDYAAVKVLAAVLGGGMSGRLFVDLRDRQGLAYSLGTLNPSRTDPGQILSYLSTSPDNADAAETEMLAEIERLRRADVSEAELERAKGYLLGNLEMDRRTNARQAWYLAFFELVGMGWDFPAQYARAVAAVTVADVRRAAERYLVRPTIVVVRPR